MTFIVLVCHLIKPNKQIITSSAFCADLIRELSHYTKTTNNINTRIALDLFTI
jgi:hypothetical protein